VDMNDGSVNEPPANPTVERTLIQGNNFSSVSHSADGGRSSATTLIAGKTQPANPPVVNNQPNVDIEGRDAQAQPAAAANPGRYPFLEHMSVT